MKLHLPTRLRAAVLACVTAVAALATTVGTGAITTGVVAYTIAASQAEAAALVNRTFEYEGVTFSGGALVTLDVADSANVEAGGSSHTLSGVDKMTVSIGSEKMLMTATSNLLNSTGKGDSGTAYTLWWDFASNKAYFGQTLRLTGATDAWTTVFNYSPVTYGGVITDAASDNGAYTIGRPTATVEFTANADAGANMLINATTTVSASAVSVKTSGAWALNKGLTLGAATTVDANKTITMTGAGALNISGALTLNAGSRIAAANNAIAVNGALSLNLDGMTTEANALISSAAAVSATGLTLNNYLTLAAGDYKLISTTNDAATALASLFESTDQFAVTNKNGVVTLTVLNTGMENLTEDLVGAPNNNFYKFCGSGLNVGEHTISANYPSAGYSALYAKGLKGSGNITYERSNGGNNLCVLWIDGDASEYTGTIAMSGPNGNVFLKLGSDAVESTDLSAATVNMTKEVIALGSHVTIGTLTTSGTQIRAVDGTTSNIAAMCNAASPTGMQNTTAGFAQANGVIRKLTITTSGELTSTTINSGVTLAIAQGASVTLAGGTVNGLISNSGALNLSGALTLNGPIMMGADSSATFANDVVLDLSRLTADEGVYHILDGAGTSNLGSLNAANVTGIDITGKTLAFDNSGTITLMDNTSDLIWKGGAGTWDETSQNWTKGGNPATFADADRVTFNDESDVTLVGDLIAGGVNVNAAVTLEGAGSLAANAITIAEAGSLTINGDASVSVDRANLNKMQVSGSGTLEINKIGTDALAFDGGEAGFSGTLALTQDVAPSGHSFTTTLTNFTGTVVIDALINHAASDFGDASKLVFVGSRDTNQIGFWCGTGINPTLEQDIEIAGDNEVRFFLNGTTLNGDMTGNKLRLHSGTGTFGGKVELNRLNLAQDGVTLNLKGDTTLGALVHDGNNTRLNVGDGEHQVTLNITGTEHRVHNTKSHTYNVAAGSVVNDNSYIELTNSTLTVTGGGTYNLNGICSSADGNYVGNVVVDTNTTLHITGTVLSAEGKQGSFMLSNWPAGGTYTVRGALISEAGISGRDGVGVINVENGGLLRLNAGIVGVTAWAGRWGRANINVKEGATLQTASTPSQNNDLTVSLAHGSTLEGVDADGDTTIAQNLTISGSEETPATANIKVGEAQSLTISSIISGEHGAVNKTGEGTLVLSGANTYAGGTTVQGGTLDAVGTLGAGDVSVGSGATIILHGQLDATKLTNNGTLEIASGFSGLEGAGVTGIAGGAEGNGFNQGGEANIFKTTGTVAGTLTAVFNGADVAIAADGTLTLDDDWGTYHINNALLETETFGAIKGAATAHSANLVGIDFAAADQTLTIDADGFATSMVGGEQATTAKLAVNDGQTIIVDSATLPSLQLAEGGSATLALQNSASATIAGITGGSTLNVTGTSSADTLTFNNGNINRVLNITDATVAAGNSGGTGFNTQATNINAGGVLRIAGGDSLGWGGNAAGLITLTGSAEKVATLQLGARQTLKTSLVMNGNSLITAITEGDHSTPMIDPYGGTLTVTGTNNVINTGVRQRSGWEITVQEDATLVFDSTVMSLETTEGTAGITKKGTGSLTFLNASGTLRNYTADAGDTILDNTVFTVGANLDLSHGGNAAGVVKLTNASALNFANGVNLWMNDHTSLEMDETSSVTFTREDYTLAIKGVTEGAPAVIAGAQNAYYDLNDACVFSNAEVTMTSSADKTMGTKMTAVSLVNAGSGTLTVSHAENTAFTSVNAQGGDITLGAATSIGSLTIAGGKTVTASAEGPLSITTALTAGAGSTLASALSIGNGAVLDLGTGDAALSLGSNAVTLGTGLVISETMMGAITSLSAEQSLTLIKGVSSLTGGDKSASDVISGLTGDYTITVQDGNLVVNAAALPAANLTWEGGDGIWGGAGTPWTNAGEASAYVEGAVVTINGAGGTITVQGAQTAKSVTIATDGYTLTRGGNSDSLTINGDLTLNNGVSAAIGFLPTVGGNMVVNAGAMLDATALGLGNESGTFNTLLNKTTGAGTLKVHGGGSTVLTGNSSVQVAHLDVDGTLEINSWKTKNSVVSIGEGKTMTVHGGQLVLESSAVLTVDGGLLDAQGGIKLGHATVGGNPGVLNMTSGDIKTTTIELAAQNHANTVNVTGGTLTITGENAFTGTGTNTTVTVSGATITNGETDMAFNHASTLTGTTISAQNDKTITVGGTGLKTTLVGALTTEGKVTLDGTTDTTGLTALNNSGALTLTSAATLSGLNNTGSLTTEGALTLADATTAGGTVTADSLTLTGANTFTAITTTGAVSVADSLNVTGMLTAGSVALNKLSLTTTALTAGSAAGNSLALTADQQAIIALMGTSHSSLTLAQVGGLTSATLNGASGFKDGSRDYTIKVENGVVTLNVAISDQFVWDATTEGAVWGSGSSWEGGQQPTAESNVVFNGTGIADVTIAGNAVAGNIFVESETNFVSNTTGKVTTDGVEITKGALTVGEKVTVNATGVTTVKDAGNLVIAGTLNTDTLAAAGKDVQLSGTLGVGSEGAVNKIDGIGGNYGHLIVGTDAATMMLDLVENTLSVAADSTVDALTVKNTGNLDAKGTFTVNSDADVAAGGVVTAAKDLTVTGSLANAGNITVGSAAAPAKLTVGSVDNAGTITVFNTMEATGDVTNTGTLNTGTLTADTISNTGTIATTGKLTTDSLSGKGTTTVTGDAAIGSLNLGNTGALTVSGTAKVNGVTGNGGSLTADTLDLSGLSSAATIANLKADKITLGGFDMLKVTDSLSNETGTGAAQLTLTLDAATMSALSVGDEKVIIATDGSVSGQGITLTNLAAVNSALKAYGIKGALVSSAAGDLVMQVQDNSFKSQLGVSENGTVGAEMMDEASAAGLATAGTALGDVYAALDACRETGDTATGDRIASALSGSSIAAMGAALSGDVERQLKAIRNRTTTMGVNQAVINEDMPYFNAWVNAEGDYRKVAADGTLAGYKMTSWGGTIGMDVDVTPTFTCGLAATAMYGDFDADGTDSASGDIDTYYVSAFGRYAAHRWTHTFVATVGLAETSLERTVMGHSVKGDSDGLLFGGMYEVGYVYALDEDATTCLQPVFNVSFTHATLNGYDESGSNIGLNAGDVEFNKLTVGAGARLQSVIGENIYNRSSILEARALVKFDAGDRQGETDVTFAGSGLPTHTVKSSETGAIGAEIGVGVTVPVGSDGGSIFADASAEIRAEYTNVNATVGYRVNF